MSNIKKFHEYIKEHHMGSDSKTISEVNEGDIAYNLQGELKIHYITGVDEENECVDIVRIDCDMEACINALTKNNVDIKDYYYKSDQGKHRFYEDYRDDLMKIVDDLETTEMTDVPYNKKGKENSVYVYKNI